MLILIDGVDLTGKTSLARELATEHGLAYLHLGPPESEALAHHLAWIADWVAAPYGLVLDRGHWSGYAYGSAGYNPGNSLGLSGFTVVESVMRRLGAVVVHCTATEEAILSRWQRGEDYIKQEAVAPLLDLFNVCAAMSTLPVIRYEIGVDDQTATRLEAAAVARNRSTKHLGAKALTITKTPAIAEALAGRVTPASFFDDVEGAPV